MAEGGDYFGYEDPYIDYDTGAVSTPYHGGEQFQMQTMMHEQSGLPDTSYAETPLLGDFFNREEKESSVDRAIAFIKDRFPKADLKKLGPISFSKKPPH